MIQGILINIDATPYTSVVSPNRNNPKTRFNTIKVVSPKVISGWVADNHSLPSLLSVSSRFLDPIRPIRYIKPFKYLFESCDVYHRSSFLVERWGYSLHYLASVKASLWPNVESAFAP
jgi:hypothetical protein